ncbi:M20 metallopeptidase family protein [Mammaliicoccus stepanovicii]|uniref:Amidohydrolase n=1 Tax=Mammaliicoccus stepanovicii TaxID=643214 RepID=A0A240A9P8_9STAP|nr:amidohydrolase [Mammaliicoccus stepanovicii]PNZ77142.1 amidohydrolase [Mammaliicoccus stepanovicii]GGI39719.1 putative amidohydrolase YhaA [Mammaliicoccus stepanovicii]SNV79784.1 amidohydrolase [Mammaliicoccus stepanovicii]
MSLVNQVETHLNELIEIRRYLHQHPELSFKEENTKKYIADYLENLGIKVKKDVGGNGLLGYIKGDHPGPTIAFRADFDALPIQDEKDVPYKSTVDGVMHACGHDAHTASLLITAKILQENTQDIHGNVVLIHQHAEEVLPGGAKSMVDAGALKDVDYLFGTHTASHIDANKIGFCAGPAYAAADSFEIEIQGQGGHGAMPQLAKDPIVAASSFIVQAQTIVSRTLDPLESAVVTFGTFNGGNAFNVIADKVKLSGTVRTYLPTVKQQIKERLNGILNGIESSFGVKCHLSYQDGYPPVVNHEAETMWVKQLASQIDSVEEAFDYPPSLGGEDVGYYLQHVPGSYFFTGVGNQSLNSTYPHHHPKFDLDEQSLQNSVKIFLSIVENSKDLKLNK